MADTNDTARPAANGEEITLNVTEARYEMPPGYTEDKPPSYDSMFGKVKAMRQESKGNVDFAKKALGTVLCGTACSAITISLMLALPIAQIVIGSLYMGQCAIERYIPIYLVVSGAFGLLKALLQIAQQICKSCCGDPDSDEDPTGVKCLRIIDGPVSCFLISWFIAGAVWTYRVHGDYQSESESLPGYCQNTLYLFAFWTITAQFILMGVLLLCCCIAGLVACCCLGKN